MTQCAVRYSEMVWSAFIYIPWCVYPLQFENVERTFTIISAGGSVTVTGESCIWMYVSTDLAMVVQKDALYLHLYMYDIYVGGFWEFSNTHD